MKEVLKEADYKKVLPIVELIDIQGAVTPSEAKVACGKSDTTTWKKGSEEGLTLTFKRSEDDGTTIDHFTGIAVAGKAVDKDKYSAVAGSVVITLKSEYHETLEAGEYLLAAQFDDGEDAEATFTIANADKTDDKVDEPEEEKADDAKIEEPEPEKPVQEAPADNTPKISDNMNVPGVLFVMDLALLGMIVVMLLIGREKKRRR